MDTQKLKRLQESLAQQRQNIAGWLQETPKKDRKIHLGPADERAAAMHLQVLDSALTKAGNGTLGVCEVCHEDIGPKHLELDFTACVCIDHFTEAQKRQLEMDLELSQQLQSALLPREVPEIPGLQLAAFSQPAAIVGGDYYDFFRFRDGAVGVVIADVMGKGLPASMLMSGLQSALRLLVPDAESPGEVVQRLNRLFSHNVHLIRFITVFLGHFAPATGILEYCNAGHFPPLLSRADGAHGMSHWLSSTGAAIGLAEGFVFETARVRLSPGDYLVLYTDGVTEAVNARGEELGQTRLAEFVREKSALSPPVLLRQLRTFLQEFTGARAFADDATIVLARLGTP